MKFQKGYIEIQADTFMQWYGKLLGLKEIKAGAFFPIIYVTNRIHPKLRDAIINHELIHFAQQKEMLLVGQWLFSFLEALYLRIAKGYSARDAYLQHAAEQEAYDNMFNLDYLSSRKAFAHINTYIKKKPITWEQLIKTFFEKEGFLAVVECHDEANKTYPTHMNAKKVSIYVLKGSITFFGGVSKTITIGERIDIPVNVDYSVIAGASGCTYIVASELAEGN